LEEKPGIEQIKEFILMSRQGHPLSIETVAHLEKGRIPIVLKTDKEAVEAALNTIGAVEPDRARVIHIKSTLEIGELEVSAAFIEEVEKREELKLIEELGPLSFDSRGALRPVKAKRETLNL
jgi:hypothetical protein